MVATRRTPIIPDLLSAEVGVVSITQMKDGVAPDCAFIFPDEKRGPAQTDTTT
jgi:hypothetical protein